MATVPTLDNFTANVATAPSARFRADVPPDQGSRMLREQGEGLMRGGDAVARATVDATREANQIRLNEALNKAKESELRRTYSKDAGFVHLRGNDALTRPDGRPLEAEAVDGYKTDLDAIEKGLGNDAQRIAFRQQAGAMVEQFRGKVQSHVAQQFAEYSIGVQQGTQKVAQEQMGLAWGDPKALEQSRFAISSAVAEEGRLRGWSGKQIEAVTKEQLSRGHAAAVTSAITSGKVDYASEYLKAWGDEMDTATRVKLHDQVRQVGDVQRGDAAADVVWAAKGPKDINDPVNLFDLEAAVRAKFKDDPTAMKAGVDAIRQRAQAWNAQQTEVNATNVNSVFGLIDGGTSLARVKQSAAWLALPETKQHEIVKALESEALAREQRGYYREGMELARMQRAEKLALMKNGSAYLAYSDPESLSRMSRVEIQALRPVLGLEATEHLLNKKDALEKPNGKLEAKMDTEDFNQVAGEMGLDPFKKNATADHKARIGTLKFRIEQLINAAQVAKKGALTREEKMGLVREEMARTVKVDPGFFRSFKDVPVIALDSKEAKQVVVPPADRAQIIKALQEKYKQAPDNPNYAPTEDNVRRLYLRSRSKAGDLVPFDGK